MKIRTVAIVTRMLSVAATNRDSRASAPAASPTRHLEAAAAEKVCRQAPAMLLEDILSRPLQEKRT